MRAKIVIVMGLLAAGCEGPEGSTGEAGDPGATGPQGPQGPTGPGNVSSITAGAGLAGGTITDVGTLSVATGGIISYMVASGSIGDQHVTFQYAAADAKGGSALEALTLEGFAAADFATAAHAHASVDISDFGAASVAAMGTKANNNPLNHDRYTDAEAVTAMGVKANTNPLHHDRYTDAEAVAAGTGTFLRDDDPGLQSIEGDLRIAQTLQVEGLIGADQGVLLGTSPFSCNAGVSGTIRWNAATVSFEGCTGSAWTPLGSGTALSQRVGRTAPMTGTSFVNQTIVGTNVCGAGVGFHPCSAWEAMVFEAMSEAPLFDQQGWVTGGFPNLDIHMRSLANGQDSLLCPAGSHITKYQSTFAHTQINAKGTLHCIADSTSLPVWCCKDNQ